MVRTAVQAARRRTRLADTRHCHVSVHALAEAFVIGVRDEFVASVATSASIRSRAGQTAFDAAALTDIVVIVVACFADA